MTDTSKEYIDKVCAAAPFADNEAGIPQMVELIHVLEAENTNLRHQLDQWINSHAALAVAEQHIREEVLEEVLAKIAALPTSRIIAREYGVELASRAVETMKGKPDE